MEINYKIYKWNEILENDFIEESTQKVTIEANSRIDLEYIVKNTIYPVYYVVITAMPIGQQYSDLNQEYTMAHIRFAIEGVNRPRISWIGLDKTPFNETDVNIILCAHNTTFQTDEGPVKVQSIARDDKGRELSKIEYEGLMPSSISGIKNKLNTDKKFNTVTIETNLYNASNELVDNIVTQYDCNELSPDLCVLESKYNNIIIIAVLILLGVLGGFIAYKRLKN